MHLIVGLGNIGARYQLTRHNIGFELIDYLADRHGIPINKEKFNGTYGQGIINGEKVILLKPSTYMNLSGECVRPFVDYFDIDLEDVIVIYDEVDFDPGVVKLRKQGSPGTHNGMKSLLQHLGSGGFPRIRIGIGNNKQMDLADYVLSRFMPDEIPIMQDAVRCAADAIETYLKNGIDYAMNHFNCKIKPADQEKEEEES